MSDDSEQRGIPVSELRDLSDLSDITDEEHLRRRALASLKRKAEFRQHLTAYLLVNGLLVGIWAVTGRGYFWPVWPILGWGLGLAFDAASLRDSAPTPQQIQAEAERLRRRGHGQAPALGAAATGPQAPTVGGGTPSAGSPAPQAGPWDAAGGPQDAR